jgi:hypothetical protein
MKKRELTNLPSSFHQRLIKKLRISKYFALSELA